MGTDPLPGMEKEMDQIPELTKVAEEYDKVKHERILLNKAEVVLKKKLLDLMHEHKLAAYTDEDIKVTIVPGEENIKVKIDPGEGSGTSGEGKETGNRGENGE